MRQKTCWGANGRFNKLWRVKRFPLNEEVHVDEFLIGEYAKGKKGRSGDSKKRLVVIALEILDKEKVGRAYAQVIDHASAKEFEPFFHAHISKESRVVTNEWKGYLVVP